ncbi:MAG: hypothetical protein KKG73_04585, partial [Gammaproteobacteria bacterium]|nr:hypothetical protein [Gammaproteobacteria bacterium]
MKSVAVKQIRRGAIVELWVGDNTEAMSIHDFQAAGFSENIAEAVARSFVALQGGNTVESQNAHWRLLRKFGNFIAQTYGDIKIIPINCLSDFEAHLAESKIALRTSGNAYNAAYGVLNWLLRNAPKLIDNRIIIERGQVASRSYSISLPRSEPPDEALITRILSCCYEEIDATQAARRIIRSIPLKTESDEFSEILRFLLKAGEGRLPTMAQLCSVPGGQGVKKELSKYGGVVEIYSYISMRELFSYYLAILVQASANPQSLREADKNCIIEIPFREDLERFVWEKKRSGRLQTPDFSKNKEWAAPNIARKLLAENSELRDLAPLRYRDALFICRTSAMNVSIPSWQSIHNCLREFQKQHELPFFTLTDLRRAGAVMHHKAGRSILAAQQRLQHKSPLVTQKYTALEDLSVHHNNKIRKFQGLMIQTARKVISSDTSLNKKSQGRNAETLFGFQCKDPLAGLADGSRPGVTCPKFQQCSSCSGAIVVVDDPSNVARLISAAEHLSVERERAISEGWSKRFDYLYQPTK